MRTVIRNLPWFEHGTSVVVHGESVVVKPEQIVLWISVAEWGLGTPHANTPRFPAILDTGREWVALITTAQDRGLKGGAG